MELGYIHTHRSRSLKLILTHFTSDVKIIISEVEIMVPK